jgi:hypothetical protein
MSTRDNKTAFMRGLRIAKEKIHFALLGRLAEYGQELLEDARFRGEYQSFTGNTLTSLAFGLYENSTLTDVVFISSVEPPVHVKVREGSFTYLAAPYEGVPRGVSGKVPITDAWGKDTSIRTLQGVCPKGGNGIVVTTGTEYSTLLEQKYDMNVLSDTALYAENNSLMDMKQWIRKDIPIEKL